MTDDTKALYDAPNIAFLRNLPHKKRPEGRHFMETWEQAFERVYKLPEPQRTQQLEMLQVLLAEQ